MSEVNKIANYNQMMSWLTRPSTPQTETRENFAEAGSAKVDGRTTRGINVERRNVIKNILEQDIENFNKNKKLYPDQKYPLNVDNIQKLVKEKTGTLPDAYIINESLEKLDPEIKSNVVKVEKGGTTSLTPKEEKLFANNYNKKTISQMATEITGLPYDNKITKAKNAQLYRYYLTQKKLGNIEEVVKGTRPKGSTPQTEKGFGAYKKAQKDLMNLDPDTYKDLTPAQVDARLKKAIQFSKVRGAFDVPTSLTPSFEHFQGITPGTITQDPDALRKVGITTQDFNFNVLGAKAKNNIYKTIKNELRTAKEAAKLGDNKAAKESLNTINEIYDDVAKKLKTIKRDTLPKYNLSKNLIKETNLKAVDFDIEKRLGNTIDNYVRFVAAGPKKDVAKIKQPNLKKAVQLVKKGDDQAVKDLIDSRLPAVRSGQLFSKLLPGLEQIAQGIKNIPDDIAKKKYFTLGLKALGPIGTYIAVDDTYEALKAGRPVAEALEYGLIGTNLIGSAKDLMALSPEEREARSVVKQAEMADQIAQDESMLDTDFETPKVKSDLTREEAEEKFEAAKARRKLENKANEAKIAKARSISIKSLKDLITGKRFQPIEMPTQAMAEGGIMRQGFADGPDDPSRRKFMKIAGGIASIPIVGKFLKPAIVAAPKVAEVVKRSADGIPEFIGDLVTKVVTFGKKNFTGNRADEFADQYRLDDYVVTQQGNKTTIQKFDDPDNPNYKEIEIELETDPETGGVTYNEASVRPDAEGKLKDVEEYIDDLDLEDMKKYTYDE
jgi:hypothetical protein